jgi:hypothetical protein
MCENIFIFVKQYINKNNIKAKRDIYYPARDCKKMFSIVKNIVFCNVCKIVI